MLVRAFTRHVAAHGSHRVALEHTVHESSVQPRFGVAASTMSENRVPLPSSVHSGQHVAHVWPQSIGGSGPPSSCGTLTIDPAAGGQLTTRNFPCALAW